MASVVTSLFRKQIKFAKPGNNFSGLEIFRGSQPPGNPFAATVRTFVDLLSSSGVKSACTCICATGSILTTELMTRRYA